MFKLIRLFIFGLLLTVSFGLGNFHTATPAFAADTTTDTCATPDPTVTPSPYLADLGYDAIRCSLPTARFSSAEALFTGLLSDYTWISAIVGVLAFFGLLGSGIMYITAGANEDRAKAAGRNIGWIITGIIIYMVAFFALGVVRSILISTPDPKVTPSELPSSSSSRAATKKPKVTSDSGNPKIAQPAPFSKSKTIVISNGQLSPAQLTIVEGTTVTWLNQDTVDQTFTAVEDAVNGKTTTADGPSEITVSAQDSAEFTFTQAGSYIYSGANNVFGNITITANPKITAVTCPSTSKVRSDKYTVTIQSDGSFDPAITYLVKGGTITWLNNTNNTQTVTPDVDRSTISGPEPRVLTAYSNSPSIFNFAGTFIYYNEKNPDQRYAICVY